MKENILYDALYVKFRRGQICDKNVQKSGCPGECICLGLEGHKGASLVGGRVVYLY